MLAKDDKASLDERWLRLFDMEIRKAWVPT